MGAERQRVSEIAERQQGVIAHRQLVALGFGRGAIRHWLSAKRLHRIHPGVYAVGHSVLGVRGRWWAAVLAFEDAVLSHRDGAALWGLVPVGPRNRVDVTVNARGLRRRTGIAVHETLTLDEKDRTVRRGIPVTELPRTLLDLAEVVPAARLTRAYETADRLRLVDVRALSALCDRSPGRRGLKPLRALIADKTLYGPDTKRELEARFFEFCRAFGLPLPACNVLVERDRERDSVLQAAGYRVVRITWRRLTEEPAAVAALLRALL
jgi:hypothetical protein